MVIHGKERGLKSTGKEREKESETQRERERDNALTLLLEDYDWWLRSTFGITHINMM